MYGNYFYFASLRKLTAAFGNMFNEIQITRKNADDTTNKIFKVPLAFGPRRNYLVKLRESIARAEGTGANIGITLPRMSFEMNGMTYDPERQLNPLHKQRGNTIADPNKMISQFSPAPYNVGFSLSIYAMNIDDVLQVVEQIVPYFTPSVHITLNEIPVLGMKKDVEILLDGVQTQIDYDGLIGDDRTIVWTLDFTCGAHLWPPTTDDVIIKKVITSIYDENPETPRLDTIITEEVTPATAGKDDPWTITETIEEPSGLSSTFTPAFSPDFE
jgi:hypothetical protein